jgi:6-phosphofructokinase 1
MKHKKALKIGILTGGGDCPGLNAVIRAVTKISINILGAELIGFKDGYEGLIKNDFIELKNKDVSGILNVGGTILGTSNIANPYRYAVERNGKVVFKDLSGRAMDNYRKNSLDAIVIIGGDGTLASAERLSRQGLNVVCVPKTIDNDLSGTEVTFGFESAVVTATEAIDKLHSTAQSHHRIMLAEVMGRYAGWIALCAGVAGGADVILIPEIPYDLKKVCRKLEERHKVGKRFSIVVVAEGAKPKGGKVSVERTVEKSFDKIRLGGIANRLMEDIEKYTGFETRATILGHVQRGGSPTAFDRNLATRFGAEAVRLIAKKKFGRMVALKNGKVASVPIHMAIKKLKLVPLDHPLMLSAKALGTSFGD